MADIALSVATPVVTAMPGAHARWEESGTIDDIARIAVDCRPARPIATSRAASTSGFPPGKPNRRGARYWDPLATFGYLAAMTERIRFATNVLVLGYHHPLEIAKRYGTLDLITGGRVILGVGVGTLKEEFDLLDAPFADRGERADDAMRALRACTVPIRTRLRRRPLPLRRACVDPCAVQTRGTAVGGWADPAIVAPGCRARRRVVPIRDHAGPGV